MSPSIVPKCRFCEKSSGHSAVCPCSAEKCKITHTEGSFIPDLTIKELVLVSTKTAIYRAEDVHGTNHICKTSAVSQKLSPPPNPELKHEATWRLTSRHHHIVHYYGEGRFVPLGSTCEHRALVMECVSGKSLDRELRDSKLEQVPLACLAVQMLLALHALESRRLPKKAKSGDWQETEVPVVHSDLNPSNIMCSDFSIKQEHRFVLIDFGQFALAEAPIGRVETGTQGYRSQEHEEKKPDPFTDRFALGVTLYEAHNGSRPTLGPGPIKERYRQYRKVLRTGGTSAPAWLTRLLGLVCSETEKAPSSEDLLLEQLPLIDREVPTWRQFLPSQTTQLLKSFARHLPPNPLDRL